jgi:hypothetical protein
MPWVKRAFEYFDLNNSGGQAAEPAAFDDKRAVQPLAHGRRPVSPSGVIGARESGYSSRPNRRRGHNAKMSAVNQGLLYTGTILGRVNTK